jgi:hypothetical protein
MIKGEATGPFLAHHFFEREEHGQGIDVSRTELPAILVAVLLGDRQDLHFSCDAVLVLAEEVALVQVIDLFEQGLFGQIELAIVLILHVVEPEDDLSVFKAVVVHQISAMDAFEQDRMIIQ